MADEPDSQAWLVPLFPGSLPRDLLADIGEMALAFAFAENRVAESLALHTKSPMANWTENSFNKNLTSLSSIRPSLESAISQMRKDARSRNAIIHGALQAFTITDERESAVTDAQAYNHSFGGHVQLISGPEVKRLATAALRFAFAVIRLTPS